MYFEHKWLIKYKNINVYAKKMVERIKISISNYNFEKKKPKTHKK